MRNLPTEIVKLSSNGGRQGNNTPSFYINRLSAYTGISNVASFVEYFMKEYAGYALSLIHIFKTDEIKDHFMHFP